ncbi:uncharacterized protein (DUF983 family) [Sphingobium fontiphilum]|uniref:Uncharacterized protein (DUF983 family) n=1 Tax=Sphingobium fontiphilum TaxID=944425 RepID=A0A7W6DFI6_9SPHN|nr:DUF983 domain-containing protein [Sphingobium fontiphilum]MBB3982341.1 uncharacterized protein (DUF983 family) [Sphingobium fontiphilum]
MTDRSPAGDRPFGPALALALRGRCPACGEGRMFASFLKPAAACAHCGQPWNVHSADDFPAYLVILLLGHILVPLMIEVNAALAIPLGVQAALWPGLALVLAVALIQPAKGAVIAFQWSRRMHGFR